MFIFIHITQYILFKVKKTFNSTHCTSKQDLEFHCNFDSICEYHVHPNNKYGIPLNWLIWYSIANSIRSSIQCIQTQHKQTG